MYRNIEGTTFMWYGEWADPVVEYNGHLYNYWTLEALLYDMYKNDCIENNKDVSDNGFEEWCSIQDLKGFMQYMEENDYFEPQDM